MKPSISAAIARTLRRHFLVRPRRFCPAQSLERDYNLGPLDLLELAACLEVRFQVDFQDQEIAEFQTFGSLVALVSRG